ncbi:uncharacterized protein LOC132555849 [Ylistrum balloti]|uniref:uncharacterized protein LOC132555849 n=1 Tax=Ylistrum balloti TaxID=509963 RepID=UPI002905D916|nr:uncharacterized protein LOC132555849 [Ylistrum balloti]
MATAIIKTAEDQITCSICLEIFQEPKALPCLHTFCKKCINKYIKEKMYQNWRENGYKCPVCRRFVPVSEQMNSNPELWAEHLENNHVASSMIDAYKTTKEHMGTCSDHPNNKAVYFCIDHSRYICSFCYPQHQGCSDLIKHDGARINDITDKLNTTRILELKRIKQDMDLLSEQWQSIENVIDKRRSALQFLNESEQNVRDEVVLMREKIDDLIRRITSSYQTSTQGTAKLQGQTIQLPCQGKPSWITGIATISSGKLLLVDHTNGAVFVFDNFLIFLCKTSINPAPYDAVAFTFADDHVMLSIPDKRELLKCHVLQDGFVEIGPKLKTNIACNAVTCDGRYVAVCSFSELQIFETDGKIWTIVLDESYESNKFTYITMSSSQRKVFITDQTYREPHIRCIDFDGVTLWKVSDRLISACSGICVKGTQLMVTSWDFGKMFTLSLNGDGLKTYNNNNISNNNTVMFPWKLHVSEQQKMICVSQHQNTLSEEDRRTIRLFKVS